MKDIYHSNDISVVVDNNILVDLYELEALDLLFKLFQVVVIPKIIYNKEVPTVIKEELENYSFELADITSELGLQTYQILVTDEGYKGLSRYDRFAISIAKEKYYYCNSNDKPVRKACDKLGVNYTGILGIIGRALIKGIITEDKFNEHLEQLLSEETSCFIDQQIIADFKDEIQGLLVR